MKKLYFILIANLIAINCAFSQGVAINNSGTVADASAMLDVSSNTKGVLSPRMTTVERNAILSPAAGLHIFNTDCNVDEYYTGTCWISMGQNLKSPSVITCSGTTDFCANESRTFAIPSVTGATSYNWQVPAGATITSGQGTTTIAVTFGNNSGSVCVHAENACESSVALCIDVHINPIPSTPGNITGLTNVYPGDNGISYFIASIVGATLYNWTVPTGCVITSGIGTSNIMIRYPCNATSNNISVTASTNCGASPPSGLAITVNPVLSASAGPAVFGGTAIGGSPTASGGKAPYTYAWSPSANLSSTVATNPIALCSGSTTTYTVTVTDVNGCTASNAVVVTRNLVANAGSPQTGPGTIGGSPTATGGQIPYIYTWSPSSGLSSTTIANPYANACATTTYSLTVTDANGCTSTNSITVTRNIVASAGSSFSGPGTIGGSPTVTGGKSPYTYSWNTSSGLSSTTVANPYANSCTTTAYSVTVTDVNGCTASNGSITITRNIVANAGSSFTRVNGCDTIGGIPVGTGGKTPYIYSWSPATGLSSTTEARPQINTTTSATYTVTVTDANACTATSSMVYTVVPATFSYTGATQPFTVPACVTLITIDAFGAQGNNSSYGGKGGEAKGTLAVTAGQVLNIYVGSQTAQFNGGGNGGNGNQGGDASDVRVGGTALSNRVIVAGGGGGYAIMYNGSYYYYTGGAGGGSTGGTGTNESNASGGGGGTQSAGGSGGSGSTTAGSAGSSGWGGGGGGWGGGGGGGYYGGGGGGWWNNGVPYYAGGGGGGSNYLGGVNSITNSQNIQSGNGQVIITY